MPDTRHHKRVSLSASRRHETAPRLLRLAWASFAMSIPLAQALTAAEVVPHNFGRNQGSEPYAGVIRDAEGNLYGTTFYGGPNYYGTIYKLDSAGNFKALYNFNGATDGRCPQGGVARDSTGSLYGTTVFGGAPRAGVTLDSGGNLYGTTTAGGSAPYCYLGVCGVVYKLDTAGSFTVLHDFGGTNDGFNPVAGVTLDAARNIYPGPT
jgi:uncharacterized repeat protein (TIGR03803 family)